MALATPAKKQKSENISNEIIKLKKKRVLWIFYIWPLSL